MEKKKVSKSVLNRLPDYLDYLKSLPEDPNAHISATALATALGKGEVQVRKDLAIVSDGGRPRIGYLREALIEDIEQFLGYDNTNDAVLIGAGKLGQALLEYRGFEEYGLNILAAFDAEPAMKQTEGGKPVYPVEELESFCRRHKVLMGIITVPNQHAQAVCDQLGSEGLKLSKAAINQTANRTIRISNASRRRRPLLNFVNVTSLSSVYSWLKKGSPGYRLFLPDAKTDNSTRLPQYCCCMD